MASSIAFAHDDKHTPDTEFNQGKELGETVDLDDAVLRAQGHEAALERSFSWVGAIGLAYRCVRQLLVFSMECCLMLA